MCDQPVRDITHITPIVTTVFGILAIIATLMRTLQFPKQFGAEDIFAILALLASLPMGALEFVMSNYGFGKDIWTIPFDNITRIVQYTWITQMLYIASQSWVKIAFLILCHQIFPKQGLRRIIYLLLALVTAYFLIYLFGLAFECLPVSYIWTQWTGETKGRCLNINAFGWSCAIYNIVLDLAIIAVPVYEVKKLSVRATKKVLIIAMFGCGCFVTVVSIIRLKAIIVFGHTTNPTYDNVPTAYWSTIECYSGIICLNMPSIRRFFKLVTGAVSQRSGEESVETPIRHNCQPSRGLSSGQSDGHAKSKPVVHDDLEAIELLKTNTKERQPII
ncbi:hypothetical protein BDV25DRAFT_138839 [Aspergillus avenaceus]|uniref:Rhodopsin domain-containing protein n=1 Tax=Aspergillus avenaceus TaxID=36643 RepID=A0A5N6TYK8_ASPAV|nr:hypothetical protein BDV25DRAFT_138839 [Aspergillus avenaceus]